MFLFDSKTFEEISYQTDSVWINDHICFINTTGISELRFEEPENKGAKICEILTFDNFQGKDQLTDINADPLTLILEFWKKSKTRDRHRACFRGKNPERSIEKICICFCALDFFPEDTLGDGPKKPG